MQLAFNIEPTDNSLSYEIPVAYDNQGRMKYNPFYHPNHGQNFSEEDLEYMCKFYEMDGRLGISLALGKTEGVISTKCNSLKKQMIIVNGKEMSKYDYYKNLNKHW